MAKANHKSSIYIYVCLISFTLAFLFQNCAFQSNSASSSADSFKVSQSGGGNGEPYDGKLLPYARLVPGIVCGDKSPAIGRLGFKDRAGLLIPIETACDKTTLPNLIPENQIRSSQFTKKYAAIKNVVYAVYDDLDTAKSKGIFTDFWCSAEGQKLEFAAEWNSTSQQLTVNKFSVENTTGLIFTASRIFDSERLNYRFNLNQNLVIDLPVSTSAKISESLHGKYYFYENGYLKTVSLNCAIGGQFDPIAPRFKYTPGENLLALLNRPIDPMVPVINKEVLGFSVTTSRGAVQGLPAGLNFNQNTGVISGTPTDLSDYLYFTITARLVFGSVSSNIRLGVGRPYYVTNPDLTQIAKTCDGGLSSNCTLYDGFRSASTTGSWTTPTILLLRTPSFKLPNKEIGVSNNVGIWSDLPNNAKVEIDAQSLSRHFSVTGNGSLNIKGLSLINGKSDVNGGSIIMYSTFFTALDCEFKNNQAKGKGGAIYSSGSFLEIRNSKFQNNSAEDNGGALFSQGVLEYSASSDYMYKFRTLITGSSFLENRSLLNGGAVAVSDAHDKVSFENNLFKNNSALQDGGGVYVFGSHSLISNAVFDSNSSSNGHAVHFMWAKTSEIVDSNLKNNSKLSTLVPSGEISWVGRDLSFFRDSADQLETTTLFLRNISTLESTDSADYHFANYSGRIALEKVNSPAAAFTKTCNRDFFKFILPSRKSDIFGRLSDYLDTTILESKSFIDLGNNQIQDNSCF